MVVAGVEIKPEDLHLVVTGIKGHRFPFRLILICCEPWGGIIKTSGEPKKAYKGTVLMLQKPKQTESVLFN